MCTSVTIGAEVLRDLCHVSGQEAVWLNKIKKQDASAAIDLILIRPDHDKVIDVVAMIDRGVLLGSTDAALVIKVYSRQYELC